MWTLIIQRSSSFLFRVEIMLDLSMILFVKFYLFLQEFKNLLENDQHSGDQKMVGWYLLLLNNPPSKKIHATIEISQTVEKIEEFCAIQYIYPNHSVSQPKHQSSPPTAGSLAPPPSVDAPTFWARTYGRPVSNP